MPESRPTQRQALIDYCLRNLGYPVIDINVDDQQLQDRVDEALQFFSEYHFDGVEKVFLKYQVQAQDITNKYISLKSDNPGIPTADQTQAATETGVTQNLHIEDLIVSVTRIWHFSESTGNMFDIRYQYALNDLYSFGTIDLVNYDLTKQYLALLQQYLSPEKSVRFSRVTNRLYIDMDWQHTVLPGSYIIIECYRILDPKIYPEVYNDRMLKKYLTALIKRQWGANLMKYNDMKLPGGISLNGRQIYEDAMAEIRDMEEKVSSYYEGPPEFFVG